MSSPVNMQEMIDERLLDPEIQEYIHGEERDLARIAFSGSPFSGVSIQELLQQIGGRRKIIKKLPHWAESKSVIYPPKINLEQTSSEATARYKAGLIRGKSLIDITGGFGVDIYYFSLVFESVEHCETDKTLSAIARHNFKVLERPNIQCFAEDGLKHIEGNKYDFCYVDPSRRHDKKGKVYYLADCTPDIPQNIDFLLGRCKTLMIKTSPMLDIKQGLKELKGAREVQIVALKNEVKELLWIVDSERSMNPKLFAVNIEEENTSITETPLEDDKEIIYSEPKSYLYEPNAAISKSGAFGFIAKKYGLSKLHPNTHLYTSDEVVDFPGRVFQIQKVLVYSKSEMKSLHAEKANVTTRNFPENVESIRKKWKLKDGGDLYLFFVTDFRNIKRVLICSK